jgi:hypothetical protein
VSVEVVVLSHFADIFKGFQDCVDTDAPELTKICIWDNVAPEGPRMQKWSHFVAVGEFNMARNGNLGLKASDRDVIYAGDDTRIIEPNTILRLQALADSEPEIGILSPRILGHAQTVQTNPAFSPLTFAPFVAFVFVFIKREVIEKIGYLDERFEGYGVEDIDYCYRARAAGFKIAVTPDVTVKHGVNGHKYGSTFIPVRGEEQMGKDDRANWARFADKWGIENDPRKIMEFIAGV